MSRTPKIELNRVTFWYKPGQNATMGLPVRNAVAIPVRAGGGPARLQGLFDGDGEPSDQERHLVQMFEIVFLDGTGEPPQAFIIAH